MNLSIARVAADEDAMTPSPFFTPFVSIVNLVFRQEDFSTPSYLRRDALYACTV